MLKSLITYHHAPAVPSTGHSANSCRQTTVAQLKRLFSLCRRCSSQRTIQPWQLLSWWLPLASSGGACSPNLYLFLSVRYGFMSAVQEKVTLQAALYLLLWLASGSLTVIVAQLMKVDLEKGWANWLQALVTIGVGAGFIALSGMYIEKVLPMPPHAKICIHTFRGDNLKRIQCKLCLSLARGNASCMASAKMLCVDIW